MHERGNRSILWGSIVLFISTLVCAGCLAVDGPMDVSPAVEFTIQPTASSSPTASQTATLKPPPTSLPATEVAVTIIPTVASTPSPVSGALSREVLSQRINAWISGDTLFEDGDRLLDEMTGEPLPLGLVVEPQSGMSIFISYHLGFMVLADDDGAPYVLSVVGFEDQQGNRFTFPFHSSTLDDICGASLRLWEGRRIDLRTKIASYQLTPRELVNLAETVEYHVNVIWSRFEGIGWPETECHEIENHYIEQAKKTVESLVDFLACEDCTPEDVPLAISIWVNVLPESFDPRIPFTKVFNVTAKN